MKVLVNGEIKDLTLFSSKKGDEYTAEIIEQCNCDRNTDGVPIMTQDDYSYWSGEDFKPGQTIQERGGITSAAPKSRNLKWYEADVNGIVFTMAMQAFDADAFDAAMQVTNVAEDPAWQGVDLSTCLVLRADSADAWSVYDSLDGKPDPNIKWGAVDGAVFAVIRPGCEITENWRGLTQGDAAIRKDVSRRMERMGDLMYMKDTRGNVIFPIEALREFSPKELNVCQRLIEEKMIGQKIGRSR